MHHSEVAHDAVLPVTWTPTRGNNIPPHAVPLHEGPNGQLYIARGLLRDEIHIGTTSYSYSEGAQLQDRYGRSYSVFEYEVLTCPSSLRFQLESPQPLTAAAVTTRTTPRPVSPPQKTHGQHAPLPWLSPSRGQPSIIPHQTREKKYQNDPPPYTSPRGGWVEAPKHSGPIALSRRESVQFKHLTQSKCFTLIDDTPSMRYSWSQTRAALTGIVDILSSDANWGGLDVRFLQHAQARPCIKTREEFESIFNSVTMWRGEKVMAAKVAQVFEEGLRRIHETSLPVVFLIVTDDIATDVQDLFDAMVHFCQRLNGECIPPHMFRIHILQIGDDRKAVQPLNTFRDQVNQRDRDRRILNVVSFHRGRGLLNAQNIIKLLLASTYIPIEEDPDIGERLPPEVIEAQYGELERIRAMGNR